MSHANIRRYLKHGTLPQLAVFEASARLGSFTRAAEELHLAQPTVSVQIKKLAETVGLPLFEQVGKRIFLTEPGRRLYATARELFRTIENVEDAFAGLRGLKSGRLRLAVSTAGKYFAPRLLAEFVQRHPGLEVSLQIKNRQELLASMTDNEADLYVFANPPQDPELVRLAILPNLMVMLARADHPLAREANISVARFAQQPFLMREPGSGTRMVAEAFFATHGFAPRVRMELSTNEAIKQAILAGLGVSIMPRYTLALEPEDDRLTCLDVEGFPLVGHWYLVYPGAKQLSLVARAFIDFARSEAKPLLSGDHAQNALSPYSEASTPAPDPGPCSAPAVLTSGVRARKRRHARRPSPRRASLKRPATGCPRPKG